jgi:hypothetical protein
LKNKKMIKKKSVPGMNGERSKHALFCQLFERDVQWKD